MLFLISLKTSMKPDAEYQIASLDNKHQLHKVVNVELDTLEITLKWIQSHLGILTQELISEEDMMKTFVLSALMVSRKFNTKTLESLSSPIVFQLSHINLIKTSNTQKFWSTTLLIGVFLLLSISKHLILSSVHSSIANFLNKDAENLTVVTGSLLLTHIHGKFLPKETLS